MNFQGIFMKKFNLFNEIIIAERPKLLEAINSQKTFGINIDGDICYEPFRTNDILIYQGKYTPEEISEATPESVLGKNYQVVEDDERVLIKAFSNWQEIIAWNTPRATYDDTTADGVAEFSDKEMEDIGWHATEFHITYRELVDLLEEKASGTVLCIEQEEPYQFSGFGFVSDFDEARDILYKHCQEIVKDKLENDDDFTVDNLEDDEAFAASFFKAL